MPQATTGDVTQCNSAAQSGTDIICSSSPGGVLLRDARTDSLLCEFFSSNRVLSALGIRNVDWGAPKLPCPSRPEMKVLNVNRRDGTQLVPVKNLWR